MPKHPSLTPPPPEWQPTLDLNDFQEVAPAAAPGGQAPYGRFVVLEAIGRGGMCQVMRGHDPTLRRDVALKQLLPRYAANAHVQRSIVDEAQITAQLDHPNIPPVHELTGERGSRVIAMKLVRGQSFDAWLAAQDTQRSPPDVLADALEVLLKLCDALAFAHARGVVHRDIKPENVLVGDYGEVYLMDWGLAQVVGEGEPNLPRISTEGSLAQPGLGRHAAVGTPAYMPPEQAAGEAVDLRADVFGLGALLYYTLVRRPPYAKGTAEEVMERARLGLWVDPATLRGDLPPRLLRVVRRALSFDPGQRFASARELGDQLRSFLRGGLHLPEVSFAAGEAVVREGEPGDTAYILTSGRVRVSRRVRGEERFLRELGPGEVFGETAILGRRARTATVVALEPVTAHVVSRELMESELGLSSWVGLFTRALVDRFAELEQRLDGGVPYEPTGPKPP